LITFNIPNCEKIYGLCPSDKLKFITSNKLKDLSYCFYRLGDNRGKIIKELEFTDLTGVTDISYMFYYGNLSNNNLTLSLPNLENAEYAFYRVSSYSTKITLNDIEKPINASNMFNANKLDVYTNKPLRLLNAT
jgi:hypothetical protein